jgi:hypothetical protein
VDEHVPVVLGIELAHAFGDRPDRGASPAVAAPTGASGRIARLLVSSYRLRGFATLTLIVAVLVAMS